MRPIRICSIPGCERPQHGQNLCSKHLLRLRRTGTTDEGRPYTQRTGSLDSVEGSLTLTTTHPLYQMWMEFRRKVNPRPVVPEWRESFHVFLAGVGEKPSPDHRLRRLNMQQPLGPDNYSWQLAMTPKGANETAEEYKARLGREYREANYDEFRDADLRRMYGQDFTFAKKMQMLEEQGHRCAICGREETETRKGRIKLLAVDHDHETKKIRGLLCKHCNVGLGHFKDDIALLTSAIAYLTKHQA